LSTNVALNNGVTFGNDLPFVLIGGMNVIEDEDIVMHVAERFVEVTSKLGIGYVFKASFDKANRSSINSFRGPGLEKGVEILSAVKRRFGVPILTDVHEPYQAEAVAEVADILQIPAFLARQTDLVVAMAKTGAVINIKKPQFLAPEEMRHIINKCREAGNSSILLCERGTSFGYNNLVVDLRSFPIMRSFGVPVVFDVTHSLQLPGGLGKATGGQSEYIENFARAGVACGVDAVFMEVHDDPSIAPSDGPNQLQLSRLEKLLTTLKQIHELVR
jgi:2-dehydro-3-deoxyphosphooctonate aldolase (KDO 8-P synthase)